MKVLQFIPTLEAGGAEGFVANLGVSLAEAGVDVRFFLMGGARGERGAVLLKRLHEANIDVSGAEDHSVRSFKNPLRLIRLIRSWRPDIVQANLFAAEFLAAAISPLCIGSGARFVRRLANADVTRGYPHMLVKALPRFYALSIANSPAVAEAYRAYMDKRRGGPLVTISNGGFLQPEVTGDATMRNARKSMGVDANNFVVAHIGRYLNDGFSTTLSTTQKAQDVLIESFAKAFAGDTTKTLLSVGDGPLRSEAEALAQRLGVGDQVRFLGRQPEPWPALQAADVFCFPSRYEGLPNVLPEAASCGLPVVASDIPEIRCISPGDSWLLKPVDDVDAFADGLREVSANIDAFRAKAQEAAPNIREKFSMETCAKLYIEAYESVLSGRAIAGEATEERS